MLIIISAFRKRNMLFNFLFLVSVTSITKYYLRKFKNSMYKCINYTKKLNSINYLSLVLKIKIYNYFIRGYRTYLYNQIFMDSSKFL